MLVLLSLRLCELQTIAAAMRLPTSASKSQLVKEIMGKFGSTNEITLDQAWFLFRIWDDVKRTLVDPEAFCSRESASQAIRTRVGDAWQKIEAIKEKNWDS